jgi:hypothetical protein
MTAGNQQPEESFGQRIQRIRAPVAAAPLDTDEETLLAMAGKVPAGLRDRARDDIEFARFLRRLPTKSATGNCTPTTRVPTRSACSPQIVSGASLPIRRGR